METLLYMISRNNEKLAYYSLLDARMFGQRTFESYKKLPDGFPHL